MRKYLLSVIYLPFLLKSFAGSQTELNLQDSARVTVKAGFSVLSSHDADLRYLNRFFIFQQTADRIVKKMDDYLESNQSYVFGNLINFNFEGSYLLNNTSGTRLLAKYHLLNSQKLEIYRDVYQLLRDGNFSLAGKMINLSGCSYQVFGYQGFGLGLKKQYQRLTYSFLINYIDQQIWQQINIADGNLYTSADGDTIKIKTNGSLSKAVKKSILYGNSAGQGFSFDIGLSWQLSKHDRLDFQISQIGLTHHKLYKLKPDTFLSFTGLDIFNGENFENYFPVELFDSLFNSQNNPEPAWLFNPVMTNLSYFHHFTDRMTISVHSGFYPWLSYIPQFQLSADYSFFKNQLILSAGLIRDYFSHYGLSFSAVYKNRSFSIEAGSRHIQSFLTSGVVGQSLFFSASKYFQ